MSNLVDHARRELEILGCTEEDILDIEKVIRAFADIGTSGSQASWMIPIINKLLMFQPLTPLTDEPDEWVEVGPNVWQNSRNSEAFSEDNGRTYYLLSEGGNQENHGLVIHVSVLKKH